MYNQSYVNHLFKSVTHNAIKLSNVTRMSALFIVEE